MLLPRIVVSILSVGMMVLSAGVAAGQDYPNKPIRIVTGTIGSGSDVMLRLIAPALSVNLGLPVIVDNRGTALISGEIVSKAPPDGYTLLVTGGSFWVAPLLRKTSYDPVKDFSPITLVDRSPNVLVVHPSMSVKSVRELIALAKARPGELNYASSGTGTSAHLAAELFKAMAGVNIVHIPYKGSGPAIIGLLGGEVKLMFATAASAASHIKSGKLMAVAVTGAEPSALAPGLPTVAAMGVPGYQAISVDAMFAPARTPGAIIKLLNRELARVLDTAEAKERLLNIGVEAISSSPEELAAMIKSEMAVWGKLIKDVDIKAD